MWMKKKKSDEAASVATCVALRMHAHSVCRFREDGSVIYFIIRSIMLQRGCKQATQLTHRVAHIRCVVVCVRADCLL